MKPSPEDTAAPNTFTAYGEKHVCVNAVRHEKNIIVIKDRIIEAWTDNDFESLTIADMQILASLDAEVILFGTGRKLRFPRPELMQPLVQAKKGLDIMDTQAACRTYNLLNSEGRHVAAALLFDSPQPETH